MIVIIQDIEEPFLYIYLTGDEVFTIVQEGTNLFLDLLNRQVCLVGKDDLAVLLVIAGVAVHVAKQDVERLVLAVRKTKPLPCHSNRRVGVLDLRLDPLEAIHAGFVK